MQKIYTKHTMGKRLILRAFEEFLHINKKKNPVGELAKAFPVREDTDGKEMGQMFSITVMMQIKTMRHHFPPTRLEKCLN